MSSVNSIPTMQVQVIWEHNLVVQFPIKCTSFDLISMIGVDMNELVTLYEMWRLRSTGDRYITSEPTPSSLAMIKEEIGCDLPSGFVRFARACPTYTALFSPIGDDITASCHQVHIIHVYRKIPGDYVHLVWPTDERVVAFHKSDPEGPIYSIERDYSDEAGVQCSERVEQIAQDFQEYLEYYVCTNAVGSRASALVILKMCQRQPVNSRYLEGAERKLRELEERQEFVISVLKKYSGFATLIAEIEQGC